MATRVFVSGIVKRGNKFLVLKRSSSAHFAPDQWEFVNGSLEAQETAEETLGRELIEEAGLELVKLNKLPIYEISDDDGNWVAIPFLVDAEGEVVLSNEHSEFKWAKPNELSRLNGVSEDWQIIRKHLDG